MTVGKGTNVYNLFSLLENDSSGSREDGVPSM